jgi:hypothetical protein
MSLLVTYNNRWNKWSKVRGWRKGNNGWVDERVGTYSIRHNYVITNCEWWTGLGHLLLYWYILITVSKGYVPYISPPNPSNPISLLWPICTTQWERAAFTLARRLIDAHAALALLKELNENNSDGGEELNDNISDDCSSTSEPQPEPMRPKHKEKPEWYALCRCKCHQHMKRWDRRKEGKAPLCKISTSGSMCASVGGDEACGTLRGQGEKCHRGQFLYFTDTAEQVACN